MAFLQQTPPNPIADGNLPMPSTRSGSHLGAQGMPAHTPTGMHFGHHKLGSARKKPRKKKGKAHGKKHPRKAARSAGGGRSGIANSFNPPSPSPGDNQPRGIGMAGNNLLTYFPPLGTFQSNTMDIYANGGGGPPPAGNPRTANVNILITGTFPEGSRNRGQQSEDYTHVILVDTQIEVHDGYTGNSQAINAGDILRIPSGVANYWVAVFVFVTQLPGVGRKKVILADRRGAVGDFTKIL